MSAAQLVIDTITSRDGTTIGFERSGDGPPLIFVRPTLADRSAGAPLMAQLGSHFTTINLRPARP
jgi:hypothetical protein